MTYWMRTTVQNEWAKLGHDTLNNLRTNAEALGLRTHTTIKEDVNFGAELWKYSYRYTDDDEKAINKLAEYFYNKGKETFLSFGSPDFQIYATWCAKWAHYAFPQIVLGSKLTAALIASSASADIKQQMNPPWEAFLIRIPNDILYTTNDKGQRIWIDHIRVCRTLHNDKNTWHWTANSLSSPVSLWQIGINAEFLDHDANKIFQSEECNKLFGDIDSLDEKVSKLIGRLIIGVCISFTGQNKAIGNAKKVKPPTKGYCKGRNGEPLIRSYEIRAPIEIDCRQAVKEYLDNNKYKCKKSGPKIQYMVRGHYRLPPGGGKGIKNVWVRPYWKGPERANIAVREYEVKE